MPNIHQVRRVLLTSAAVAAVAGNTQALDGSGETNSSAASFTVSVTTSVANSIIILAFISNAGGLSTAPTATGLTFSLGSNGSPELGVGYYYSDAASAGAHVVTVTPNSASFTTAVAFGVSNSSSAVFDGSIVTGHPDPQAITTTNANDFIFAVYKMSGTASPTAGSGWTLISGADFCCVEYKVVSATGTYSATMTTGNGDANGGLVHALKQG